MTCPKCGEPLTTPTCFLCGCEPETYTKPCKRCWCKGMCTGHREALVSLEDGLSQPPVTFCPVCPRSPDAQYTPVKPTKVDPAPGVQRHYGFTGQRRIRVGGTVRAAD